VENEEEEKRWKADDMHTSLSLALQQKLALSVCLSVHSLSLSPPLSFPLSPFSLILFLLLLWCVPNYVFTYLSVFHSISV
jgi:hypothetical protein